MAKALYTNSNDQLSAQRAAVSQAEQADNSQQHNHYLASVKEATATCEKGDKVDDGLHWTFTGAQPPLWGCRPPITEAPCFCYISLNKQGLRAENKKTEHVFNHAFQFATRDQ